MFLNRPELLVTQLSDIQMCHLYMCIYIYMYVYIYPTINVNKQQINKKIPLCGEIHVYKQ